MPVSLIRSLQSILLSLESPAQPRRYPHPVPQGPQSREGAKRGLPCSFKPEKSWYAPPKLPTWEQQSACHSPDVSKASFEPGSRECPPRCRQGRLGGAKGSLGKAKPLVSPFMAKSCVPYGREFCKSSNDSFDIDATCLGHYTQTSLGPWLGGQPQQHGPFHHARDQAPFEISLNKARTCQEAAETQESLSMVRRQELGPKEITQPAQACVSSTHNSNPWEGEPAYRLIPCRGQTKWEVGADNVSQA